MKRFRGWEEAISHIQGQNIILFILSGSIQLYDVAYMDETSYMYRHTHAFHELLYVLDGGLCVDAGGQRFTLAAGDILSIPAGTAHLLDASCGAFELVRINLMYLCHSRETISRTPHLAKLQECIEDEIFLVDNFRRVGLAKVHDDGSCFQELHNMVQCIERHYTGDYIRMTSYLACLYTVTLQNFLPQKVRSSFEDCAERTTNRMINLGTQISGYVRKNYMFPISLDDAAQALNYSPRHIQRTTQEYYGFTFSHLLKCYRVEAIARILATESPSRKELADRVGYRSTKLMDTHFKEITGTCISEYKRAIERDKNAAAQQDDN